MARATNWYHLDLIRNVRIVKETPRWVILEDMAVFMGLLSGYKGDSPFSEFLVARATNWHHLDPIRSVRKVVETPELMLLCQL